MAYPPTNSITSIVQAIQSELALPLNGLLDATGQQLASLMTSAGIELMLFYPWQQLSKDFTVVLDGVSQEYNLPTDWEYFVDQTQWDSSNQWPLMGPTSAQQWQWLQNGVVSSMPRIRWRVRANKFQVFPVTETSTLVMEYISGEWVTSSDGLTFYRTIQTGTDISLLDPFLLQKYVKLKFWESKGFNTAAFRDDFMRVYWNLLGKDKGAPVLSLVPSRRSNLITVYNVPDGSWTV
jgi:hypothetical protein